MIFLTSLRRRAEASDDAAEFPLSLPLIRDLSELAFTTPVTFLVGENGSGKSTLLEGIAAGIDAVAVGGHDLRRDPTLEAAQRMARSFWFARRRNPRTRLFLRAEDVFGFTGRVTAEIADLRQQIEELRAELPEGLGKAMALGAVGAQRHALISSYGQNPDAKSHGETFLSVLRRRIVPDGLYLLDEPETPLSPARVLALMALIAQWVEDGSQFIIATHSPILMALPGARILLAEDGRLRETVWDELEHVRVTRAFLADPGAMLEKVLSK